MKDIERLKNRYIARLLTKLEPIDDCRKNAIKQEIRWLADDVERVTKDNEGNERDETPTTSDP